MFILAIIRLQVKDYRGLLNLQNVFAADIIAYLSASKLNAFAEILIRSYISLLSHSVVNRGSTMNRSVKRIYCNSKYQHVLNLVIIE
ncbi:MAG: hypothetical protein FKGGLIKP_00022 [Sodalis sp. Fse]|nr:MAG: hypothetical protein FKGGLIKP_00022 [Sodalis sp. Fse]UVK79028.1 MAG: hypothetical protein IGNPGNKH_00507 [Sodalis sp. Ffu]